VLYLCENNGKYGHGKTSGTMRSAGMAVYPLTDLPRAYKIPAQQVDGSDAGTVYLVVDQAIQKIRAGEGPQFIEAQTVRWPGSLSNWPVLPIATQVSFAWDLSAVPDAAKDWYRFSDPVLSFIRSLVSERHATREQIEDMEKNAKDKVGDAVEFAFKSPEPDPKSALDGVFAGR
jgi:TPP-dependent pyruvate/acetoin dehydrogenase alpha subunit